MRYRLARTWRIPNFPAPRVRREAGRGAPSRGRSPHTWPRASGARTWTPPGSPPRARRQATAGASGSPGAGGWTALSSGTRGCPRRGEVLTTPPKLGDDSDTEGASLCSSTQRAPEVQLPFPVEQIVSLSRNDFQNVLKEHRLTREQLDFVQDVRRRSKNCIAARRCRKRKLDCIYSLECEIEKLRCEKQTLEQERTHLAQVKRQTWQDISGLCQKVLSEAALQPEQLHVLAKYATPDCPLSSLLAP
ncbi:hypothetical protein ANANG_G00164360 [Anguilla anguilla]|uniref:BZIP domain-containing protein n=1 Tax=Anguilla anguilla TaxID=7936 RepID=A0A9D3M9Y1_ANGAN|nr:hypothetical protein ANANG_G00164360 [Anguilla anguilla]